MTNRRASHRAGSRRRRDASSARSPLTAAGRGDRGRRRRSRRARALALVLLLALGAVAWVAAASGTGSQSRRTAAAGSSTATRRPQAPDQRRRFGARKLHLFHEDQAVNRVLAYTPFVTVGTPRRRVIALTFDDGPSPYTAPIVSILARFHVQATFFVVGQQLNDFASGLRDEVSHGFDVGDHTENHAWLAHLDQAGQYGQIHDAAIRIERGGVPFPRLFRPPYGAYDAQTLATIRQLRMLMVLWTIDTGDYLRPASSVIAARVLQAAQPGAIVLMHDGGGDRSQTVGALPEIITGLRRRHYRLVTVPQLLAVDPPPRHQALPQQGGS